MPKKEPTVIDLFNLPNDWLEQDAREKVRARLARKRTQIRERNRNAYLARKRGRADVEIIATRDSREVLVKLRPGICTVVDLEAGSVSAPQSISSALRDEGWRLEGKNAAPR